MKPWWDPASYHPVAPLAPVEARHGPGCECLKLLELVGADRRSLRFGYCLHVLQRHWDLTCQHGMTTPRPVDRAPPDRWRGSGRIDAVRAILVRNA